MNAGHGAKQRDRPWRQRKAGVPAVPELKCEPQSSCTAFQSGIECQGAQTWAQDLQPLPAWEDSKKYQGG